MSSDASNQIKQMIEFIKQEAREKAEEIQVKTDAEFNAKKLNLVHLARMEIKEEYAKKRKQASAEKRIAQSRLVNSARFEQMRRRDALLKELKQEVTNRLAEVSKNPKYPDLIKTLIIEGLITIMEPKVEVRCRQVDLNIVQRQLQPALEEFKALMKQECNLVPEVVVSLNSSDFLPPPPSATHSGIACTGGVTLAARGGKIVCRNTLDARAEHAFHDLLPTVRELLFGKRADPIVKPNTNAHHHH